MHIHNTERYDSIRVRLIKPSDRIMYSLLIWPCSLQHSIHLLMSSTIISILEQ